MNLDCAITKRRDEIRAESLMAASSVIAAMPLAATGSITAIGIGTSNLSAAQKFYSTAFGYSRGTKLSFGVWDEAIMMPKGGGPALIPMKFSAAKETKNLPVKLGFHCPDPKALQAKIVSSGGKAVEKSALATGAKEGTLYATDPEGYLLELIPGDRGVGLSSAGYGSSNITQSASFWAQLAGTTATAQVKKEAWDMVTVPTRKAMTLQFLTMRDGRNTKNLPLKIVWGVGSMAGFKSTITSAGGKLEQGKSLGGIVGIAFDPVDQIIIEINQGGI